MRSMVQAGQRRSRRRTLSRRLGVLLTSEFILVVSVPLRFYYLEKGSRREDHDIETRRRTRTRKIIVSEPWPPLPSSLSPLILPASIL